MTRRLTMTIIGVVVATLVLVGLGTLAVAGVRARATTTAELRRQAADLAGAMTDTLTAGLDTTADADALNRALQRRVALLRRIGRLLQLDDISVVVVDGSRIRGDLPAVVDPSELDLVALRAGGVQDGHDRSVVWAIAATSEGPANRVIAVVVTRVASRGLGDAFRWFLVAAVLTLGLGLMAASALGRRLTRPIREATTAAHRIADGQFDTRLVDAGGQDELAELARSINTMAGGLERAKGLEQEFLLSVSHDLRTPLTSIRGYAEAILDGAGDPGRAAGVILTESQRLERLVADLLDLAKLQSASFRFDLTPVDLAAAVEACAASFGPSLVARGLVVRSGRLDRSVAAVDRDRLGQILANLVENAAKYARSTIEMGVAVEGRTAVVTVDDDGPGIAPADRPHVFDRLYVSRLAPQRRENSSGLGLAIVRELTHAMGGEVSALAAPLGGARFTVAFPTISGPLPPPAP